MEKTGAAPKARRASTASGDGFRSGYQCAPGAFGDRCRRLSLPDTWIRRRLRRCRCLPGDHRLPHDGEGFERAEARSFFAVDFLDDADAQDLSCACGAHHCVRRRRLVRDLAGRISAAFAPGAVGADLLVELRLQERQRLFRHGGPDQATVAHLVAVAGMAVLFLHAADRWPGLAACFARHVRDQRGGHCAAGLRGPVTGVVSVGKPARCDGIVLLLPAGESLGAVGRRIDRCSRDPAPIGRQSPIPPGCNRRSLLSQAGCWSRAASSIPCPKRDGPACSRSCRSWARP